MRRNSRCAVQYESHAPSSWRSCCSQQRGRRTSSSASRSRHSWPRSEAGRADTCALSARAQNHSRASARSSCSRCLAASGSAAAAPDACSRLEPARASPSCSAAQRARLTSRSSWQRAVRQETATRQRAAWLRRGCLCGCWRRRRWRGACRRCTWCCVPRTPCCKTARSLALLAASRWLLWRMRTARHSASPRRTTAFTTRMRCMQTRRGMWGRHSRRASRRSSRPRNSRRCSSSRKSNIGGISGDRWRASEGYLKLQRPCRWSRRSRCRLARTRAAHRAIWPATPPAARAGPPAPSPPPSSESRRCRTAPPPRWSRASTRMLAPSRPAPSATSCTCSIHTPTARSRACARRAGARQACASASARQVAAVVLALVALRRRRPVRWRRRWRERCGDCGDCSCGGAGHSG
mmetsp:Transcript_22790/g.47897  ORF Transcript_22790/g.47897 Transcript_22790/m.47897 type:complete len:408 (+) Transcript_22790:396-1619(+)